MNFLLTMGIFIEKKISILEDKGRIYVYFQIIYLRVTDI